MVASLHHAQKIERLTALSDVLDRIDRLVAVVAPRRCAVAAAAGRILAADVVTAVRRPGCAIALRDGWAVRAGETADAGSYVPAPLSTPPMQVDAGDELPAGADAVAPRETVEFRSNVATALLSIVPGEGVLTEGADATMGETLLRAGNPVRQVDIAVLRQLGIGEVVVREPRVRLAAVRSDPIFEAATEFLAHAISAAGGTIETVRNGIEINDIESVLVPAGADAIIVVGGTGAGRRDRSVHSLARVGRVEVYGVALAPGETAAVGVTGEIPVLLVPGRLDATLAVWLTVGRRIMDRLGGRADDQTAVFVTLSRKIASPLGLAEIIPVCRDGDTVAPLAAGYLPMAALARADGWIMVPADSEGHPAGARVEMRALP